MPSYGARLLLVATTVAAPLAAQRDDSLPPAPPVAETALQRSDTLEAVSRPRGWVGLQVPGSIADENARLRQLRGEVSPAGFLARSASSEMAAPTAGGTRVHVGLVAPTLWIAYGSDIPLYLRDGPEWVGRGVSGGASLGVRIDVGPVRLIAAPQFARTENRGFVLPPVDPARSAFSSPWYTGTHSADLPLRYGTDPITSYHPGESSVSLHLGPVALGGATESQWWGPGVRNAIVMSAHPGGFPHLFARTNRPLRVGVGELEGRLVAGVLTASPYFAPRPARGNRTLSAFTLSFRPDAEPMLTVGMARAVYESGDLRHLGGDAVNAFFRGGEQQLTSVFGRWLLPASGAEVYGEWALSRLPSSLGAFGTRPGYGSGYTVGGAWSRPVGGAVLRLRAEATNLEQSDSVAGRPIPTFYTSAAVPQGYTHRGRPLGAAIGPGASSQWLALDLDRGAAGAGVYANRVRWNNDIYYAQPVGRGYHAQDVTTVAGIRGRIGVMGGVLSGDVARESRLNFLFQNPFLLFGGAGAVDVVNYTVRLGWSPRS